MIVPTTLETKLMSLLLRPRGNPENTSKHNVFKMAIWLFFILIESLLCFCFYLERQDEVIYYDAYESPDAMQSTYEIASPGPLLRDEVTKLQQRTRQLEARRGRITAKKAYLRNKKVWHTISIMLTEIYKEHKILVGRARLLWEKI